MELLENVFKLLKIRQYIKNLIIFLPAIFTHTIDHCSDLFEVIKVFAAFCLVSSAVYIFNDLKDMHEDRKHPIKCNRPIASGKISPVVGGILFGILVLLALFLGQYIESACNICIWLYLILNICYSFWLRDMKFVDVICIAFGFVLRLSSGFYALSLPVVGELAVMIFVTSIFFTTSKRVLEQKFLPNIESRRHSMRYISSEFLYKVLYVSAGLSVICYYIATKEFDVYIPQLHITTICFAAFIGRLLYLIKNTKDHDDPMNFIIGDTWIKIISGLSFMVLVTVYI